jgi:hypothetical protein
MSTALWMLEEGGYDVTILDRAETLPAPDAASCGESDPVALSSSQNAVLNSSHRSEQGDYCSYHQLGSRKPCHRNQ